MKFKLFCTMTMKTYYIEADSEFGAKKKLAKELGYPLSTIIRWDK